MYEKLKKDLAEKFDYWQQDIRDEDAQDLSSNIMEILSSTDKFLLYKYTPANYFDIRNFETQSLHLSPNNSMNDIYEGIPVAEEETLSTEQIVCMKDLARFTCFSETYDNILMWSHYAKSHEGFCVEYDLKLLKKEESLDLLQHIFPVLYLDKRLKRKDINSLIESHLEMSKALLNDEKYDCGDPLDDVLPLFLVKGKAWEYEQEWRMIFTKKQQYDMDNKNLETIPFECITGIYLGYRINPEIERNILEICKRQNRKIAVYKSKLSNSEFKLEFEEVCH